MEKDESRSPTPEKEELGGGDFVSEGMHVSLALTNEGISWTILATKKSGMFTLLIGNGCSGIFVLKVVLARKSYLPYIVLG